MVGPQLKNRRKGRGTGNRCNVARKLMYVGEDGFQLWSFHNLRVRLREPLEDLCRLHQFTKCIAKPIKSRLMLFLRRSATSIRDKPGFKASIESRPRSCIHTTICHHPTDDYPLNALLFQYVRKIRVEEAIVCVFVDEGTALSCFGNIRHQLPILRPSGNGAGGTPLLD